MPVVRFEWLSGIRQSVFSGLRIRGSWDATGNYSDSWTTSPMQAFVAEDGCRAWFTEIDLDRSDPDAEFHWGVIGDGPAGPDSWLIPTEIASGSNTAQYRILKPGQSVARYHFNISRRFGANKIFLPDHPDPAIRFTVSAPRAQAVDLVVGEAVSGYIGEDGSGVTQSFAMAPGKNGWQTDDGDPAFAAFADWDRKLYMFRIRRDDGSIRYRTDLFSRGQIGSGHKDPEVPKPNEAPWNGTRQDVEGSKSCSIVVDPEHVTAVLNEGVFPETQWLTDTEFWASEHDPLRPVPQQLRDLVIYELHVEGLGCGRPTPGTFADAIAMLDGLCTLGINAIELLPTAEAEGWSWGYGTSHHFATEYAGGGRDELKHFVRACHRHGIAVLMDVVYNHWIGDAERCEWLYDSVAPKSNRYYWYEGPASRWPDPADGYVDNGSTGFAPNYRDALVRRLFASSALVFLTEFHIDGFRVDLTQAFHRDNVLHGNGDSCAEANRYGAKMLREWVRTLRLARPSVMLVAEDHSGWSAITESNDTGGIGFDAIWWAEWYHHLIGDSQNNADNARLLHVAGAGGDQPLAMSRLGGVLMHTAGHVIYHESHDQAGNATYEVDGRQVASARTIEVAANGHLDGNRRWAEARCRVVAGLTLFAAGTPMFFMGEEVGAREPYRYDDWIEHREDFAALGAGSGAALRWFYRDAIWLRRSRATLRAVDTAVVHAHDANRVLAFRRWHGAAQALVVASLANTAYDQGYRLTSPALPDGEWREVLNSDAAIYGGAGLRNPGPISCRGGALEVRLPACGIIVLEHLGTA
ncbi:MAG: alpha-amylase family glycosyl hydrolase [Tardiphaga sp.]